MAVASSSNSISDQQKKMKSSKKETKPHKQNDNGCPLPAKRTKSPGVRVHRGRVYDSTNGKTCHQCRQKTMDFAAYCKTQKQNSLCAMKFCQKCLLNRYGEKAEEVEALENWSCPKCRGICNCSCCMKKRGHQPTGALTQTAKATGFSSVSELLHVKGAENFVYKKIVKDVGALPQKMTPSGKEAVIASPRKRGKENLFDGNLDTNLNPLVSNSVEGKQKKMKQEGLKKIPTGNRDSGALSVDTSPHPIEKKTKKMKREELKGNGDDNALSKEASPKKPRITIEIYNKEVNTKGKVDVDLQEEKDSDTKVPNNNRDNQTGKDLEGLDGTENQNDGAHCKTMVESLKVNGAALEFVNKSIGADPLPQGKELTTVAGADLPPEDVGNALQFLEFCATFGKILNLNKGQPEAVLRELIHGRSGRRGKYSTALQFHIHLLSFLQKELGEMSPTLSPGSGKTSWLNALKDCISESQFVMDSVPLDCLDGKDGGYDALDFSQKLKILNVLCDEILGTVKIRNWIDDQNTRFAEKDKEAREKLLAAKDKEKQMKQKMLDEVAKAVIAKNGVPLSISEHEALVSQIKSEAAQAHAEMLESKGMIPNKKQRPDAMRTDSIFTDNNGCAYWRLKCYFDKKDIICQDIGTGYAVASGEKWFAYNVEQKKVIEKHISLRGRKLRPRRVKEIFQTKCSA